jgi:hypothetical protein
VAAGASPAPATPSEVVAVVQAVLRLRAARLRLALEAKENALLVERAERMARLLKVVVGDFRAGS